MHMIKIHIQLLSDISMGSDAILTHSAMHRKKQGEETTRIAQDTAFGSSYGLTLPSLVIIS